MKTGGFWLPRRNRRICKNACTNFAHYLMPENDNMPYVHHLEVVPADPTGI